MKVFSIAIAIGLLASGCSSEAETACSRDELSRQMLQWGRRVGELAEKAADGNAGAGAQFQQYQKELQALAPKLAAWGQEMQSGRADGEKQRELCREYSSLNVRWNNANR